MPGLAGPPASIQFNGKSTADHMETGSLAHVEPHQGTISPIKS